MKIEEFDKLWELLIVNYGGTHNEQKRLTYHYLKNYSAQEAASAIEKTIKNNRYFPNVNEILNYLPNTQFESEEITPIWVKHPELCVSKEMSKEEKQEMEELLKEFEEE